MKPETPLTMPTDLIPRSEVARMLSVHTETVKRWQRSGRLRAFVLSPTVVRYSRTDVDALLAGSAVNYAA